MKQTAAIVLILLLLGAASSVRILEERYVAFRTLLGDPSPWWFPWMESELSGPTLYVAVPLIHHVDIFDKRLKLFESDPRELLLDEYTVEIGYFAVWRIENVRRLRENLQSKQILPLIDDKTYNAVRNELATRSLGDLLSEVRADLSEAIRVKSDSELDKVGIEVLAVTIRQVEFTSTTLQNVFDRMKEDRGRLAKRLRAEGEEQARQIRAAADRDAEIELARARGEASRLRGAGDAQAASIYAEAYGQDREFYRFVRSLEAYRKALDEETTVVLSPDDPFLRYLFDETRSARPSDEKPPVATPPAGASSSGERSEPEAPTAGVATP